ncbi:MAG: hypothetical protein HZC36_00350 [Armatimonadetes bacterium]|nr:hypothetical protein [Armatimonadota bacterium]
MSAITHKFDLSRYAEAIEASKLRLAAARRFEEPDRVPILLAMGGSFFCKQLGINVRDFFKDAYGSLDLQIEVQLHGLYWCFEELQDDRTGASLGIDFGPIGEAIAFDLPVDYPDDTSPWILRTMSLEEAEAKLRVIEPEDNPRVQEVYRQVDRLKEKADKLGLGLPTGGGVGIHPPLSAACGFLDVEEIMLALHDDPMLVHQVFEKMFLMFIKLKDYHDRRYGVRSTGLGLCDDHSAFISDALYRQHVMPYNMALYGRYGSKDRYLHADGPNDHHFATYADVMKLTSMDMGGFSQIENAKRDLGGKVFFSGGLNCKDLYGDFASAKPAIDHALSVGMPGGGYALAIGGETYAGVNPDTLCKAVAYAKEAGRYGKGD